MSKGALGAIIAVVVVIVIILALFLTGVIPGFKTSSSPSGPTYDVTFGQTGLAGGTSWSVTLGGSTLSSTGASIVFSEKNGTYSYTVGAVSGFTPTPASGSVTVTGAAQSVSITFSPSAPGTYEVTFTESGLTSGTSWSVTLNSVLMNSTGTTVVFSEKNGTYSYTVGTVAGYTAAPSSGSVTVAGMAVGESISFSVSTGPSGPGYQVTFTQTGLPSTDLWFVDAIWAGGSAATIGFGVQNTGPKTEFAAPNGKYFWAAGTDVPGLVAVPAAGNLTVSSSPVTISIKFEPSYTVFFNETGLKTSASWTVDLNGTNSSNDAPGNITFQEINGTYPWTASALGYTASPASGTVTVNGANVTVDIVFTPVPTYKVTFNETGLPAGTFWFGELGPLTNFSRAPAGMTFEVPNGQYRYSVFASGYTASPSNGTLTVSSAPVTQSFTFTKIVGYAITFSENGLPTGVYWSVDLNGAVNSTPAPGTLGFEEPNGVYGWAAFATGYTASPPSGNITVSGGPASQTVTFTAIPPTKVYPVVFTETGLAPGSTWNVSIVNNGLPIATGNFSCSNTTSTSNQLNCSVENGYYSYLVWTVQGNYSATTNGAGGLMISGAGASVDVTFTNTSADFLVAFSETWYFLTGDSGLPNGTSWSVTIGGTTQTTTGMFVFFFEPNGTTVGYTITAPAGYLAIPSAGNVTGFSNPAQSWDWLFTSPTVGVAFPASGGAAVTLHVATGLGADIPISVLYNERLATAAFREA